MGNEAVDMICSILPGKCQGITLGGVGKSQKLFLETSEYEREGTLITKEKGRWIKHLHGSRKLKEAGMNEGQRIIKKDGVLKSFKRKTLQKVSKVPISYSTLFARFITLTPTAAAWAWCLTNPWCFFLFQPKDHIWFGTFITCSKEMIQVLGQAPQSLAPLRQL